MNYVLIMATILPNSGCLNRQQPGHEADSNEPLLKLIANKEETEENVIKAIRQLGNVTEAPSFWTHIANSETYNTVHRRHAVYQFFRRHVTPGMPLSELAKTADKPTWLKSEDILLISRLGGKIPVKWTFGDTIFRIQVFPSLPGDFWTIYMRVSGKVDLDSFTNLFLYQEAGKIKDNKVAEIGFSRSIDEVYKKK